MDEAFWIQFASQYWEKKALLVKDSSSVLSQMTEQDIFEMLVQFANRCRRKKDVQGFKFFIHGFRASDYDVLQILPAKKDKNLQGYHQRMNLLFKDYCLVCDDLLHVSAKHQAELSAFTHQMYKHIGFPNRFTEIGLYMGNYRKTPFGVHVDSCGVFSFPVVGEKRFRLWEPDYVAQNPSLNRAHSYAKHKKQSQLMTLKAGDMSYWPSSAWHIAESSGEFSATWSLGVWVDKEQNQVISEVVQKLMATRLSSTVSQPTTQFKKLHGDDGEVSELPQDYILAIQKIKNISTSNIRQALLNSWMKHISARGFKSLPNHPLQIVAQKLKLLNPDSKVLWLQDVGTKNLIFSYGGQSYEGTFDPSLLSWIKDINSGISQKAHSYKGKKLNSKSLSIINSLALAGAFADADTRGKSAS